MHLRLAIPPLLALTSFACLITPGVLEGGTDESNDTSGEVGTDDSGGTDESGDSSNTQPTTAALDDSDSDSGDESELAECLRGTNPQGGSDPGDFAVDNCSAFVCDEGWGHDATALAIAWTLEFARPESESSDLYSAVGVVSRAEGDGVSIVVRRDAGPELLTVSAEGELLAATMLPTSLYISSIAARGGRIFLAAFDEADSSSSVLAIDEAGQLLWSTPITSTSAIQSLAAVPDGGVLVASITAGGGGELIRLGPTGTTKSMSLTATVRLVGVGSA
ncbi:hypothetical protein ACNOYE_30000 [Nannocystaceae bacterium ST9]